MSWPEGARDDGGRVSERVIHHSLTYACTRECPEIIERERRNRFSSVMLATEISFVSRASRTYGKADRIEKWKLPRGISIFKMLMRLFASTIATFESA